MFQINIEDSVLQLQAEVTGSGSGDHDWFG